MIRIITTLFLLCTYYCSNCQSETNYYFDIDEYLMTHDNRFYKTEKGIKSIETQFVKWKDKSPKISKCYYNPEGLLVKSEKIKGGIPVINSILKYNDQNKLIESIIYKKDKEFKKTIKKYDEKDRLISTEIVKRQRKLKVKNEWVYTNQGKCASSIRYKKDGKSIHRQWKYEYYENGKISRSLLLNGKGKVLHEWTYDCDQEGELQKAEKNKSKFCIWKKVNDDTLISSIQELDQKGRIRKYVTGYTSKDTLILFYKIYDFKNRLKAHYLYDRSDKKLTEIRWYNKKGKMTYIAKTSYSGNNILQEIAFNKGKQIYKRNYTYQPDGLLIKKEEWFRNKLSTATFIYVR